MSDTVTITLDREEATEVKLILGNSTAVQVPVVTGETAAQRAWDKIRAALDTPAQEQRLEIDASDYEEARHDPKTKELHRRADEYGERLRRNEAQERSQGSSSGHRVEIDFDYGAPGVKLLHPEGGCPESEEGDPCFLTGWLENEGAELLRGKLTLPVRWEVPQDRDHPLFLLTEQLPSGPLGDEERERLREEKLTGDEAVSALAVATRGVSPPSRSSHWRQPMTSTAQVSPTPRLRREVDDHLRTVEEPQSAAQIADALGQHLLSGVFFHLAALEREGRASSRPEGYSKVWSSTGEGEPTNDH